MSTMDETISAREKDENQNKADDQSPSLEDSAKSDVVTQDTTRRTLQRGKTLDVSPDEVERITDVRCSSTVDELKDESEISLPTKETEEVELGEDLQFDQSEEKNTNARLENVSKAKASPQMNVQTTNDDTKNKKKLKKQLSVRFADVENVEEHEEEQQRTSSIKQDGRKPRFETVTRTRTVRDHLRDGLMRMLHPDSYEVDAFPIDQEVQSYQTFDWDSATRHRHRTSSVSESVADSVTSPVSRLQRLDSVISAISEDELDLYKQRRGKPSLHRMESVISCATGDSEAFSEGKNYFNFPSPEGTTGKSYKMVYDRCKPFAAKDRDPFIEEDNVFVYITDIGQVSGSSERTFNPNLYFIEIHHGHCIWTVRRRYHHFLKLHEEILIYKATLIIPFGDQNHRERSRAYREISQRRLPHFPRTPDALVRSRNMAKRMSQLQKYLQAVLNNHVLRNHPSVLEFFEVSELSFIDELGLKAKEGWVTKKSGGHHVPSGICSCCPSCKIKARYSKRWLITKDSFVAYVRPNDGEMRTVMLFDRSFNVQCGKEDTGRSKCLIISNQHRALRMRCTSKLAAREWMVEVLKAVKGSEYCQHYPNGSFAPVRIQNFAHWFADGELYFQSVADAIEAAQEEIFITDWWFNPDIYLKRPAVEGHKWKVDELLKRKASQGIKIFILLYKEVEIALGLDSKRTKYKLQHLHPNIKVMRHPDHPPGGIILWAHHEKLVVVDQAVAFVGGLDICYGRWDDFKHTLTDLGSVTHSSEKTSERHKMMVTTTSLGNYQPCQSGNSPNSPVPKQTSLPSKLSSFHLETINDADEVETNSPKKDGNDGLKRKMTDDVFKMMGPSSTNGNVDVVDGALQSKEKQENGEDVVVPVTVVEEKLAKLGVKGKARLWPGKDYCNFVARDVIQPHLAFQDSVDRSTTPRMPWHDISAVVYGNAARDVARHFIERWNSTKEQKTKEKQSYPFLVPKSNKFHAALPCDKVEGTTKCTCQILRSADHWSAGVKEKEDSIHQAYLKVIDQAKHYLYIENQFFISIANSNEVTNGIADALFKRIIRAHRNNETFRVYVLQPLLPSFQGEVGSDSGKSIHAILHWEYLSMCRGKDSLLERLKASGVTTPQQYIVFNGLRNWGELEGELVSELVYIHSKLLIADDNVVIIGSANINDRSLLGSRDSEMAVLITDTETVDSVMNGKIYQAGVYALGLRQRLFKEHLGILQGHWKEDVSDPVSEYFFKGVWMLTASNNTANFEKVFRCAPTNSTRTFQQLKQFKEIPTLASVNKTEALRVLKNIRGFLVFTPLEFLSEESLEPSITTQEGIAPTKLWT